MKGLHVVFQGWTASYPYPFLRSGTALSMPLPPYSSIFGMLSACSGSDIHPNGKMRIGFEFTSSSRETIDIEKTHRLKMDQKGRLKSNLETGIVKRQFHVHPKLDLYLTDMSLKRIFESPVTPPRFGRSQDLAWIISVKEITLEKVEQGQVRSTLIPYTGIPLGQVMPPLVDYFINNMERRTRTPGRISRYAALPATNPVTGFPLSSSPEMPLYHPDDSDLDNHAIVMMDFQ
jgi:CRISPR-associated protein Cas5t